STCCLSSCFALAISFGSGSIGRVPSTSPFGWTHRPIASSIRCYWPPAPPCLSFSSAWRRCGIPVVGRRGLYSEQVRGVAFARELGEPHGIAVCFHTFAGVAATTGEVELDRWLARTLVQRTQTRTRSTTRTAAR